MVNNTDNMADFMTICLLGTIIVDSKQRWITQMHLYSKEQSKIYLTKHLTFAQYICNFI